MHSGLTINQVVNGYADIVISFEPRRHYVFKDIVCNFYFDGPGGAVGHAFYPLRNAGETLRTFKNFSPLIAVYYTPPF